MRSLLMIPLTVALAAGTSTSLGCATTQTTGEQIDDNTLTRKVGTQLAANQEVRRYQIDVDTLNRVVTLRGEVDSEQDKSTAEQIARNTKGVKEVRNELQVKMPEHEQYDMSEDKDEVPTPNDAWIVSKVTSKLTADPEIRKMNIDVDSIDGVVTLSGIVKTEEDKREAEKIVKKTDGVLQVNNELKVRGNRWKQPSEDEKHHKKTKQSTKKHDKSKHHKDKRHGKKHDPYDTPETDE